MTWITSGHRGIRHFGSRKRMGQTVWGKACAAFVVWLAAQASIGLGFWATAQSASAASQTPQASSVVQAITVEGLHRVTLQALRAEIRTQVDQELNRVVVGEDLQRLWATQLFDDLRVDVAPHPKGGIQLFYWVQEKPTVRSVNFSGFDAVSEEDLKEAIGLQTGTVLKKSQIDSDIAKIRDLYLTQGYYLVQVRHTATQVPPPIVAGHAPPKDAVPDVAVTYAIQENAKVQVREIRFMGNQNVAADDLRAGMQTRQGNELSFLTQSGTYKEEFFQTDLFRIQAIYYDRGYVAAKVGDPLLQISGDKRFVDIRIPVSEGDRFKIGDIGFSGDIELEAEKGDKAIDAPRLARNLQIQSDTFFARSTLFADIQRITELYRDRGFAYANVVPNSSLRPGDKKIDLDLQIDRGERYDIGVIQIVGNTKTRDKVIRRQMQVFEGERYSGSGIRLSKARIFQLGYFETVELKESPGDGPNLINITVEIKEKSTGTFQVGAGFSSVESFIATAQISQNNFLGNGQLLSVSAQLSFGDFARQLATFQFQDPFFLDSRWFLGINAYITQRFFRDFQRNATGFSPSFGYPLTHELRLTAGYTIERIDISTDFDGSQQGIARFGSDFQGGINSAVSLSLSYDSRDNRLFPTKGMYHVLSGEISDSALGSTDILGYRRVQLFTRFYYPLPLSMVLRFNASIGMVFGGGPNGVLVSERFFPGGIFSVRGFPPRGLGPVESTLVAGDPFSEAVDFTRGGNKELVFNLEVEFPIIKAAGIRGVIFADAGNAYNENENFFYLDTPERPQAFLIGSNRPIGVPLGLYYSFGFGFRWLSPIGPLRFEWGIPITKRTPRSRDIIFEFTIGNFF